MAVDDGGRLYVNGSLLINAWKDQPVTTYTGNIQISKAVIPVETAKGKIVKLKRGGRRVEWAGGGKKGKLRVSGSKTEIMVGGKAAKRKALEVGMACEFTYQASAAKKIACN